MIFSPYRAAIKRLLFSFILAALLATPMQVQAAVSNVLSVSAVPNGITFRLKTGLLRLQVWSPDIIRETYVVGTRFQYEKSLAVVGTPIATRWHKISGHGYVGIETLDVQARVDLATGAVSYFNHAGRPLLLEARDGGKHLAPVILPGLTPVSAFSSEADFVKDPNEDLYGLGEHQDHDGSGDSQHLNYGNETIKLEQDYITNLDIPFTVSSKGYGLFWDNPATTTVGNASPPLPISPAQLIDSSGTPGALTGQYYSGVNFDTLVKTERDPQIDYDWSTKPPPGLNHDQYSVRWTGAIQVVKGGSYTFTTVGDDGINLWIDGKEIIDDWSDHPAATDTATVVFPDNSRHTVRMDYYQDHFDATVKLSWSQPSADEQWRSNAAKNIDYYFIYGPSIDRVIRGYRNVTGQAPMPPKWALGYWQSKEHYATQQEWLDITKTYRDKQEPIDNIVQDWFYWDPYPWGSNEMDPKRYPDPAGAIQQLHDTYHMHIMISVWGKFSPDNKAGSDANYDALNAKGYLYPYSVRSPDRFYDAFNPAARAMYWGFMRDQLLTKGFDAWWLDASEPEANLSALAQVQTGAGLGAFVLNAWPLEHTSAVYDGQRVDAPGQRVFILTRSAFAGEQRNAATVWSSDITGTWQVFAHQIPNALNMTLSGLPYWSSDTGGFFCNYPGGSANPAYGELFTRWFQFSAFSSIFRVHGTNTPKELWRFGPTYEPILVKYDRLRYRLMPYIYSQAWSVTHDGGSIMRALVFDFPQDKTARELADEYLFGPSILVCPVTEETAFSRKVYLPKGADWYDFWTGSKIQGGQSITAEAPIQTLPLYVRAGSILPLGPFEQYTTEKPADPLGIRVYRGANASFTLYEDEGTNYNYNKGLYSTIQFYWNEDSKTLTIGKRHGTYPGMLNSRTLRIIFVTPGIGTGVELATASKVVRYNGSKVTVHP
jgi:alpha-D-xyloside xylohydrolase